MTPLADGIIAVVKRDCPTCALVGPVLRALSDAREDFVVYTQDDSGFPHGVASVVDDSGLEVSYKLGIETVPALIEVSGGREIGRRVGWARRAWEDLTGVAPLGEGLPEQRPGCGSRSVEPGIAEELEVRYGSRLKSRSVEIGGLEDDAEAMFARGWTDGLPVVAPTPERVIRMLACTRRPSDEAVAVVPPNGIECSVEKAAINAVMAGCKPDYLPVVLAALEAACTPEFNIHGLLATTYFAGPVVIVNGPIARGIGMNSGINALGQGNRANATIGRALQLIVRNVGGGRPGEVDRATLGNPGKYTFCFAEDEAGSPWEPLSVERGFDPGASTVTLFAGEGSRGIYDQLSRTPESLARSFAACLRTVAHPKWPLFFDAFVVISPEHARVLGEAAWTKQRLRAEIMELLQLPRAELVAGAGGIAEGISDSLEGDVFPKFRDEGLWFVHAGGTAGLFSAIIGSWTNTGSRPVTKEVVV